MTRQRVQATLWDEEEIEAAQQRVKVGIVCRWLFAPEEYPQFMCESCCGTTSDLPNRAHDMKVIYRAPNERKRERCCACFQLF